MAAEVWRVPFKKRVEAAASRLERGRGRLSAALPFLTSRMLAGAAEAVGDRIRRALGELDEASSDLAFAISTMKAAELLALHGSSFHPSMRLARISHLGHQYLAERNAGTKLPDAGKDAREAYTNVDSCRSHLDAVLLLLDHADVPCVDGLIGAERIAAVGDLEAAIGYAGLSTEKAAAAQQDLSGAN